MVIHQVEVDFMEDRADYFERLFFSKNIWDEAASYFSIGLALELLPLEQV